MCHESTTGLPLWTMMGTVGLLSLLLQDGETFYIIHLKCACIYVITGITVLMSSKLTHFVS